VGWVKGVKVSIFSLMAHRLEIGLTRPFFSSTGLAFFGVSFTNIL